MRLAVLALLVSAILPSVSLGQGPVFTVTPEESDVKFFVKATLNLTITGKGTGNGEIKGTMAFDRKEFGMNSGIPFIKIADRVEVNVAHKGHRVSGPPLVYKE
jgi:hypothetical protein